MEEIKSIRISELKDFKNHPFHVQQDMELCALMKSIEDEGVIVPLLVRPNPDGEGYEVIAGHRRKADAGWAGLAEVLAVIRELIGSGTLFGIQIIPLSWYVKEGGHYLNNGLFIMPPMALILIGYLI